MLSGLCHIEAWLYSAELNKNVEVLFDTNVRTGPYFMFFFHFRCLAMPPSMVSYKILLNFVYCAL